MELEKEKAPLHLVSAKRSDNIELRAVKKAETKKRLKHTFLIKIAVLTDIILTDKELTLSHIREVTKLLGQVARFYDL